ncbi:hypothetical protein [Chryseobacterium mulctrae]|uniref:hypothetical protein n=1 Tax=Chryseobacterium mulctrae TaxID=2576777 RepID=UPI00111697BD|nr:hypothetical protein [Chryseobacterium mulctrae]
MKNKLLTLTVLSFTGYFAHAQVSINTTSPTAMLDVVSKGNTSATKALEINNSSDIEMVTVLNNGNVGINVPNPAVKLHIVSTAGAGFQLVDGSQAANKVLTSDDNGVGTWKTVSSGAASITGTEPITASTASGVTTVGINRNSITEGTSVANTGDAFVLSGGIANSIVGGSNVNLTINNTAPLWNANQLQGIPLSNTAPTTTQVLTYNGTTWAPAALPALSSAWATTGNTGITATGALLGATISSGNFLGTIEDQSLVFATFNKVKAILDTNGNMKGGNSNTSAPYASFAWGSNNNLVNNTSSNVALGRNNSVSAQGGAFPGAAVGYNNYAINGAKAIGNNNGIRISDGAILNLSGSSALAFGNDNYGSGIAIGNQNSTDGFALGTANTVGPNNFAFGISNTAIVGSKFMVFGVNGTAAGDQSVYANKSHAFYGQANATTTIVGINMAPTADATKGAAIQIKGFGATLGDSCTPADEGAIRYNSTAKVHEGCNGTIWKAFYTNP